MEEKALLIELKRSECYQWAKRDGYQGELLATFGPGAKFCELIFDGLMCWNATRAGVEAKQLCPSYFAESRGYATKRCEDDGRWLMDNTTNRHWTNYTECWDLIDDETAAVDIALGKDFAKLYVAWLPILKEVLHWGYGISLVALITAMVVFLTIRKLQCARNRLHMHLFVSFIMRAFMSLLKDYLLFRGTAMYSDVVELEDGKNYIKEHHTWICKAIISAQNYFIMANYMLILMEGIYLHNLIFSKLFSDNSKITLYSIFGWGIPLLFLIPFVFVRIYLEDSMCWTTWNNQDYNFIIDVPIIVSILINFILFINIVRILVVKLNSIYLQQRKIKYRRLMRSTLTLVPLFGVPYTITLILSCSSSINATFELVWLFADQTFIALQGFFVALVYCFMNSEVHNEVRHRYNSLRNSRRILDRSKRVRTISNILQYTTNGTNEGDFDGDISLHEIGPTMPALCANGTH